ncbi:hypothetical protein C4J89_0330 [Pseudomonas sp. R4-35-07]|uniref:hypothetical protein n=1 Tax=Pseudomonas sp. R4-35-07 TaxID=658643 RepID=UPI000F55C883|nr:hypothetical protein [Pseudomonas sp. R4-35-07]AZF29836.1 hypothetical protein C4J89_0330 [Pseudomonas sp. R4-35-07]
MISSHHKAHVFKKFLKLITYLIGCSALTLSCLVFANSSALFSDESLDMYDAPKLIEEGRYKEAKAILIKEEKSITDLSRLCSIYSYMLGISSITENKSEGAKYAELFQKCYSVDSDPYVFLGVMTLYFKGEYEKAERITDKLLNKVSGELIKGGKSDAKIFMDKNLVSSMYRLKAFIILSRDEPQKMKYTVVSFAEKSYEVTPFGDAEAFLAAIYQLYGETNLSKSLLEKSDGRTSEAHAADVILNSLKQKVNNAPGLSQ